MIDNLNNRNPDLSRIFLFPNFAIYRGVSFTVLNFKKLSGFECTGRLPNNSNNYANWPLVTVCKENASANGQLMSQIWFIFRSRRLISAKVVFFSDISQNGLVGLPIF